MLVARSLFRALAVSAQSSPFDAQAHLIVVVRRSVSKRSQQGYEKKPKRNHVCPRDTTKGRLFGLFASVLLARGSDTRARGVIAKLAVRRTHSCNCRSRPCSLRAKREKERQKAELKHMRRVKKQPRLLTATRAVKRWLRSMACLCLSVPCLCCAYVRERAMHACCATAVRGRALRERERGPDPVPACLWTSWPATWQLLAGHRRVVESIELCSFYVRSLIDSHPRACIARGCGGRSLTL